MSYGQNSVWWASGRERTRAADGSGGRRSDWVPGLVCRVSGGRCGGEWAGGAKSGLVGGWAGRMTDQYPQRT